ncbi:hypothetical protein HYDPIDRAFT_115801 [Hydnomerulius pinastri MD-312]|uniref:Unplaced genomic scaffold scaffold_27, whole genome shotgun sequence n=1 Tax=Hydnomerulius pinastri MD-312 TaxID=994086 RepID=A0A0C9WCG7_9AGAM|nr:hypothetical protein HYDPIDRAFT_115801 [Hydnomerulius pinastri MD-312]
MDGTTSSSPSDEITILEPGHDETPQATPQEPPQPDVLRPSLEEVLAKASSALELEFASSISRSVMEEANRTELFRKVLRKNLFLTIVKTYAWSNARLVHEAHVAERALETHVQDLLQAEKEQGRSSHPPHTFFGMRAMALLVFVVGMVAVTDLRSCSFIKISPVLVSPSCSPRSTGLFQPLHRLDLDVPTM